MSASAKWTVRWHESIAEIDRGQWDELAVPLATPLMEWSWLHHLEASGSISPRYGWQPCHLTFWDRGKLIGAAPLYIKTHSDGEFIFDHWLAQLAEEFGVRYYPKMIGMSPATPSVGYRFLMAEGLDQIDLMQRMLTAIDGCCHREGLSCCHLNFVDAPWFAKCASRDFISWQHQSYLWKNQGFTSFEDYICTFKSSQRHNIRRERRSMERQHITIRTFSGDAIAPDMAALMYRYYLNTNERYGPWAARFLGGDFFKRIFRDYRHRLLIIAAYQGASSSPLALSMLLVKDRHLIGRYWGCEAPVKDLHFNMCFYAPIEWAIENHIQTFDPGAGSPHKIYRGFTAVANTSLHRLYDPRLQAIFDHLIDQMNAMAESGIDSLNRHLPLGNESGRRASGHQHTPGRE